MNNSALIGHTGFVGGNILNQRSFDFLYNSKNIDEIAGKKFEFVVCSGAPGTKRLALQNPENDLASIEKLINNLKKVEAKKIVLISTIDVYSPCDSVDEDTTINKKNLNPYGKHRRMLEEFVENKFYYLIIRLPAIFGNGLKKNAIYDLMHGSHQFIHPGTISQFYYLEHLWADVNKALENNLKILNIATEPIAIKEIAEKIFNTKIKNEISGPAPYYDMHTKHAHLWKKEKPYLYLKDEILEDLRLFIESSR